MARARTQVAWGRTALLWATVLSLALGVGGWLAPFSVEAASLKSLQGTVTPVPSATAVVVTLSPSVDATKAFVVCSARTGGVGSSNQRVTCVLTNTTLTIDGGTNIGATVSVSWYVAEFEGGVSVQRATATFNANSTTPSAAPSLTAVDCTKSFVVLAGEQTNLASASTTDQEVTFRAILGTAATPCISGTSSTLTLTRTTTTASPATMAWQVVTYEGASVQRGVVTLLAGGATTTATLGTAVDTTKSFILMSRQAGLSVAGVEAEYQVRAAFTTTGPSVTGLTFTRVSTTTSANHQANLSWQVVALSDGSSVLTGTTTSTATGPTMSTALTIDTTRTVPIFTASGGSGTTSTHLDDTSWTVALTSTSINFTRAGTLAVASSAAWFTVSFNKCALTDATNVAANAQSGQATVYWDSAIALIARNTVDFTASDVLVNGQAYAVSGTFGTSSPLPIVQSNSSSAAASFNQSGLTNGTTYYYRVFKKTDSPGPCYGPGATSTKTNVTPTSGVLPNPNWSYATGQTTLAPPGLTPNGVVVSGSNASKLYGMSASNGTQSFTPFPTGNAIQARPPVIPSSLSSTSVTVAYVTSQDGFVYAIDTSNGTQVWQSASLGTTLQGGAAVWLQGVKPFSVTTPPQPDLVVVGTKNSDATSNKVYGLHGELGTTIWTFSPGNMDIIVSTPFIDYTNNTIWVTSRSNLTTQASLWKLNAANGTIITRVPSAGPWVDIDGSPSNSLDGSFLYVPNNAGNLMAINVSTNAVVATHIPLLGAGAIQGSPVPFSFSTPSVATPDTIVFSRSATVHSVSFNGTSFGTNWTTINFPSLPVTSVSAPVDNFDGTKVYVGASGGKAHQLRLSDGVDEAQVNFVGPSTPTGGDPSFDITLGRVYVGATDGLIYSFTSPF